VKINLSAAALVLAFLVIPATAQAARNLLTCGITPGQPLTNGYGPLDFTNPKHHSKLPIVIGAHFTPEVERLIKGSTGSVHGDIDYTLRAIPNYHRALHAIAKYQRLGRKMHKRYYNAECYFKRAIYLQPKDDISKMLFAIHLHMTGKLKLAKIQYELALRIRPEGAELNYNYGLLLIDLKLYKKAQQAATIAYSKGYPLQGLKNKLAKYQG